MLADSLTAARSISGNLGAFRFGAAHETAHAEDPAEEQ